MAIRQVQNLFDSLMRCEPAEKKLQDQRMLTAPLKFDSSHLYVVLDGNEWLFDTGSPKSFGTVESLQVEGKEYSIPDSYMGLDAAELSTFSEHPVCGLLGADIINESYVVIDVDKNEVSFSADEITLEGSTLEVDEFMGIPLIDAEIAGNSYRMFFDTGAQVSYFQHSSLDSFPSAGPVTDFYPGYGQFNTETHLVEACIGGHPQTLRCGSLPKMLGAALMMGGAKGIIGNEILQRHTVGYFPKSKKLVLA